MRNQRYIRKPDEGQTLTKDRPQRWTDPDEGQTVNEHQLSDNTRD